MFDEMTRLEVEDSAATWTAYPAVAVEQAPARPARPNADTEMPPWIWKVMMLEYAVFFAGLLLGVGRDREAIFMLVISIGYTVMYFGTARVLLGVDPAPKPARFARGLGPLRTWTGPMSVGAVAAQILVVPGCLAFFGVAIAVIRTFAL